MVTVQKLCGAPSHVDSARLVSWHKQEGDAISLGETLCTFQTDEGTFPLIADVAGVLLWRLRPVGGLVAVNHATAVVGEAGDTIGYPRDAVFCIRLKLMVGCSECGHQFPVNRLVRHIQCPLCHHRRSIAPEVWNDWVADAFIEDLPQAVEGDSISVRIRGEHGLIRVAAMRLPPVCRSCQHLISWNDLLSVDCPGTVSCRRCSEGYTVREPPAWFGDLPHLSLLFGEVEDSESAAATHDPVLFQCTACAAPLEVDGSHRIVTCRYCSADQYLPDDLWMHFRQVATRLPWWWVFHKANDTD